MELTYRLAIKAGLVDIVRVLSDDPLKRENFQLSLPDSYQQAVDIINNNKRQELRAQIEAGRVILTNRNRGIGKAIFPYAIQ